jgi:phosphoribosylformylglycinamidine synthase
MNPNYGKIDSYWMAASAIDEAVRNNTAVGGRRIALLDNFTWGNPEKRDRMGELVRACQACYDFATAFQTPFISGKDSLYNESQVGSVTPTLLITAVGVIPDVRKTVSMEAKEPDNLVYIIGRTHRELGGSEYYRSNGFIGNTVPKVRATEVRKIISGTVKAVDSGCIRACHDISEGGLGVATAEMAFSGGYGMELDLERVPTSEGIRRSDFVLFSESNSRFLVEVPERRKEEFESLMRSSVYSRIGKITETRSLHILGLNGKTIVDVPLAELREWWKSGLEGK